MITADILRTGTPDIIREALNGTEITPAFFRELEQNGLDDQGLRNLTAAVKGTPKEAQLVELFAERRSDVADQLIGWVHQEAVDKGVISEALMKRYEDLMFLAEEYQRAPNDNKSAALQDAVGKFKDLTPEEILQIGRVMSMDAVVLGATQSYDVSKNIYYPETQFAKFLDEEFAKANTSGGQAAVDALAGKLAEIKDTMLISMVYTAHPTVFHTLPAIEFQQQITGHMEALGEATMNVHIGPKTIPDLKVAEPNEAFPTKGTSRSDNAWLRLVKDIQQEIADMAEYVKGDAKGPKSLTQIKKVTVGDETKIEKWFHPLIKSYVEKAAEGFNNAVEEVAKKYSISVEKQQVMKFGEADIAKVEFRTWGRSADADGREKATSIELYKAAESIRAEKDGIPGIGEFIGPTLDLRQNAEVHLNAASACIQKAVSHSMRNGREYLDFCNEFIISRNGGKGIEFDPKQNTFHDLSEKDRVDFIKGMIERGFSLIPSDSRERIARDTLSFQETHSEEWGIFVKTHADRIRAKGYDPETVNPAQLDTIRYVRKSGDIGRGEADEQAQTINDEYTLWGLYRKELAQKWNFLISDDGLGYSTNRFDITQDYLARTVKPGSNPQEPVTIGKEERVTLMDVFKRLVVINEAIDKAEAIEPGSGEKMANRYKIANFENASDFYIIFKFMEEAGLISLNAERTQVTNVKMGIMPLLETEQDMKNAPEIFKAILNDPLMVSYYKERGFADVMLGFSDGAKSAGNFASQWQIYKTMEELTAVFAAKGIDVHFHEGRGHGENRGGTIEPGIEAALRPDVVNKNVYSDVTVQADLPVKMGMSQAFGVHYIASKIEGLFRAALVAEKEKDPAIEARMNAAVDWIANRSSEIFNETVRQNPDTLKFLATLPDNPDRSSREPKRGGETVKNPYDAMRAISFEYLMNNAKLPMHVVGLRQALEEFMDGKAGDIGKINGKEGKEALAELRKGSRFFNAIVETQKSAAEQLDANIARGYGKSANMPKYVEKLIAAIDGTKELLDGIERPKSWQDRVDQFGRTDVKAPKNTSELADLLKGGKREGWRELPGETWTFGQESVAGALNAAGQVLMFVLGEKGLEAGISKPFRPTRADEGKLPGISAMVKTLLSVLTNAIARKDTSPELQVAPAATLER